MNSQQRVLVKVGGSILHEDGLVTSLCHELKDIVLSGYQVVLVHGGSKAIHEALHLYGVTSTFLDGLRVTTAAAMKVIEMVLCGQINQLLVRKLNSLGVNAIGLSGAHNHLFHCEPYSSEHGFVGEIKSLNTTYLEHLSQFQGSLIPVIATIGVDDAGQAYNINADLAASRLAHALKVKKLIYMTDQEGIYNKEGHVHHQLSKSELSMLIDEKIVTNGMLVKAKSILFALERNFKEVMVLSGQKKNSLIEAVLYQKNGGTVCVNEI